LIAYIVAASSALLAANELRSYLSGMLPDFLVPAQFEFLDALPVTSSGKRDRRALPAPRSTRPAPADTFVAPRDPVEQVLVGIWSDVLRVEKVGIQDSFFELGGDSILSLQIVSRIRATLQIDVPLRALFEGPTVAGLAGVLRRDAEQYAELERVAAVVLSLAQLSDAEVEAMLASRTP
jgi:acyl carrier protein